MLIIVGLVLLTLTINTIIICSTWRASINQQRESSIAQSRYYLASTPLQASDLDILDNIINEVFTRYQILNLTHEDNLYINDAKQEQIIVDIFKEVYSSLSPNIMEKLSLIYNREYIEDLLVQKIKMIVLNFTIEVNGNYKEK
jgi:hypothetical protein